MTEHSGFAGTIDRISIATGKMASWLTLVMVVVTFVVVVLRYAFDTGLIWLQESITWMHAIVFMLGAAYTLQQDEHVRVDIFYRDMDARRRALIDLFGVVAFVFPLCLFFIVESLEYVGASWSIREVSREAGGLPYPFVPMLKSALIAMPVAVMLQGISMVLRSLSTIKSSG